MSKPFFLSLCAALAASLLSFPALSQPVEDASTAAVQADVPVSSTDSAPVNALSSDQPETSTVIDTPLPASSFDVAILFQITPPERSSKGRELATNPDALTSIDQWIAQTDIDNPQNLKLKDILMAMPVSVSGPRLVELAKKTQTPSIQDHWAKWLSQYPDAYENVLRSWLKLSSPNSNQFHDLLGKYAKLNPQNALDVWAQLVSNFPARDLGKTASFGLENPLCTPAIISRLAGVWDSLKQSDANASPDNPSILRLMSTYSQCRSLQTSAEGTQSCAERRNSYRQSAYSPGDDAYKDVVSDIVEQLLGGAVSRRIVAIDFSFGWTQKQPKILEIYESSKNTTEKAHALRALQEFCDEKQPERILDALANGDETLRLEAASLIDKYPLDKFPADKLQTAFDKELWPETQALLYRSIVRSLDHGKTDWIRSIYLDSKRSEALRLLALDDLFEAGNGHVTLDDMSSLINAQAPAELIISTAEHLYVADPASRPTLRTWILAQQPFERRLLITFARFMNVDSSAKDPSAIESMRAVCKTAHEQENILQPCLNYFEVNAQTEEDREMYERMLQRKNQFDAMLNIEF